VLHIFCSLWHASSQLSPSSPITIATFGGRGDEEGPYCNQGRPSLEKQKRRSSINAFSCSVLRDVVRHNPRQYSNAVLQYPVPGWLKPRGTSFRRDSGLFPGERQHETQYSYSEQHWSSAWQLHTGRREELKGAFVYHRENY